MERLGFIWFFLFLQLYGCKSQGVESNIILVNLDTLDRAGIAEEVRTLESFEPKVIAIDAVFENDTDLEKDRLLIAALYHCHKLVMASTIDGFDGANHDYASFEPGSIPTFLLRAKTGFTNTIIENDDLGTLKKFSIQERVQGIVEYHFAIRTAMEFDSLQTITFIKNHSKIVDIDYKSGKRKFKVIQASEIFEGKISKEDISGKIVLMGDMGPWEDDKFFTPLNKKTTLFEPDMYGVEYLAHIVAQVLEYKK